MNLTPPHHEEIDHHTIKLIVGVIALTFANLTSLFSVTEPVMAGVKDCEVKA